MKEKHKKKKGRTWVEAAKIVMEMNPNSPLNHKDIHHVIQKEGLKDVSGTGSLACLNAMLHSNAKGPDGIFYKCAGKMGVYGLKSHLSEEAIAMLEMQDEDEYGNIEVLEDDVDDRRRKVLCVLPEGAITSLRQADSVSGMIPEEHHYPRNRITPHHNRVSERVAHMESMRAAEARSSINGQDSFMSNKKQQTICEIMASIPGLSRKPRKKFNKKMSPAAQIERSKVGCVDLETPDSILCNTNLRALINKHVFSSLPGHCQHRLLKQLPSVDRIAGADNAWRLSSTALNNEFFTRACVEWRERLADGEFTPENQMKIKQDAEKEHAKTDPWKVKHFEPVWGKSYLEDPVVLRCDAFVSRTVPSKSRSEASFVSRTVPNKSRSETSFVSRTVPNKSQTTLKISKVTSSLASSASFVKKSVLSNGSSRKKLSQNKRGQTTSSRTAFTKKTGSASGYTKPRILQSPRLVRMLNEPSELGEIPDMVQQAAARTAVKRPTCRSMLDTDPPPEKKVKVTVQEILLEKSEYAHDTNLQDQQLTLGTALQDQQLALDTTLQDQQLALDTALQDQQLALDTALQDQQLALGTDIARGKKKKVPTATLR